jgi:thimet oligopeptidase
MVKIIALGLVGILLIGLSINLAYCSRKSEHKLFHITSAQDVVALFAHTPDTIRKKVASAIAQARKEVNAIISISDEQRTFANTAQALDAISGTSDAAILYPLLSCLELVSPDAAIRDAAHEGQLKLQEFFVDYISGNEKLYKALKSYASERAAQENLTFEQQYFIQETLEDFERDGLALSAEKLAQVRALKKEITALALDFEKNVAQDNSTITVSRAELDGLDADFIDSLKKVSSQKTDKDSQEQYLLEVNAPTWMQVLKNCAVADTRKKMHLAWENRAYPANGSVLKTVIAKRDELAKILGFESYDAYAISGQMAKTADRVHSFLLDLITKAGIKEEQEFAQLIADLPASVQKTPAGKLWEWDVQYTKTQYKKKHFDLDDRVVSEYFPMEKTIEKILELYQTFLSLTFKQITVTGLWHDEAKLVGIYRQVNGGEQLLGYLLLDLYPRPNKYGHAAHETIVPAVFDAQGLPNAKVAIVLANFPKSTATKPSLLLHRDVETFFHEFGHAMHGMLGRTKLALQSGTHVKNDFVEVPSQMFEEWVWDPEILKQLSGHYKTGEALTDDLIQKIVALKKFDSGYFILRQSQLSLLDQTLFAQGADKDPYALLQAQLQARPRVAFSAGDHMYASFIHLMGYGAKYYSYMWSKVYALDLFAAVKREGLTNPAVGQRLIAQVLGKGGSAEPADLLRDFLGREPNMQAFLENLGLQGADAQVKG